MINSSKRLEAVFRMADQTEAIGDIGCDHGYISFALLEANKSKKVIATDISKPSLEKAQTLLGASFETRRFSTRLGDGFDVISQGELNGAIIIGLGGKLIADILERGMPKVRDLDYLILQPMQGAEDLFSYLSEGTFKRVQVDLIEEKNKYYPTLKVVYGGDDSFSWKNFSHLSSFSAMAEKELKRLRGVAVAVEKSNNPQVIQRAKEEVTRWEAYIEGI